MMRNFGEKTEIGRIRVVRKKKEKKFRGWRAGRQFPMVNDGPVYFSTLSHKAESPGGIKQAPEPINSKYEYIHVVSGGLAPIPEMITKEEIIAEKDNLVEQLDWEMDREEHPEDYD